MPKAYTPSSWSHLRGFPEWPNAPGLIDRPIRGKNPSRALCLAGHHCLLQSTGTPGNISAPTPLLTAAATGSPQGMRTASSAALLQKAFPCSGRCSPAEKAR